MTLLADINRYLKRTNMPPTRFGRLAVNDPRLIADLRRGRSPGASTVARVQHFIRSGQA